ncbi:hypothetical protein Ahy_B02g057499 isoform C [Arachis hypogaea]|nr:hypothetical protein Ahy_B02g057499 isoform C [Arachis hypogaea]
MTRSRSSELRRYTEMQNAQAAQENWSHQKPVNVQAMSNGQVDHGVLQRLEGSMNFVMDSFANQTNQMYLGTASQEPSQSESSAAAPVVSSGLDACEGFREQIMDNLKDDRKRRSLDRYGSVSSAVSEEKVDTTKKRRVNIQGSIMAEAKERNLTPSVPSDMQAVLKRCETLEKEVRSLKFNLSFMNRKDSEQTKQIEDLQRQNKSWQMKKSTS